MRWFILTFFFYAPKTSPFILFVLSFLVRSDEVSQDLTFRTLNRWTFRPWCPLDSLWTCSDVGSIALIPQKTSIRNDFRKIKAYIPPIKDLKTFLEGLIPTSCAWMFTLSLFLCSLSILVPRLNLENCLQVLESLSSLPESEHPLEEYKWTLKPGTETFRSLSPMWTLYHTPDGRKDVGTCKIVYTILYLYKMGEPSKAHKHYENFFELAIKFPHLAIKFPLLAIKFPLFFTSRHPSNLWYY